MTMKNEELCINTIRILSAEAIQKAKSGHPGTPMGSAPMAFTLWSRHMKHNPDIPSWIDRDRFILSAGHASMLLYSLLYLFGYGLTLEDLASFRQWGSLTPGHPEYGLTPGVETTSGPLGQGFANAVGMAISENILAAGFNKPGYEIINHYTYALSGDGCMMEGITSEAASLAGTLGLGRLIVFYDSNSITIEGSTDIAFREDVAKRFEAYGWQVLEVTDGNDVAAIDKAITEAKSELTKPTLIKVTTIIGYGCVLKQGKASAHGEPLGVDSIRETRSFFNYCTEGPFKVPPEVLESMQAVKTGLIAGYDEWNRLMQAYAAEYPQLAAALEDRFSGKLPDLLNDEMYWHFDNKPEATRNLSGVMINRLAPRIPSLIGGSADLAPSNKTLIKDGGDFSSVNHSGRNLHFGVREHAMAAIANGISLHGGNRVYVGTFFVFCDYMKGAMRLSALMKQPVIYVLTHDSIGVGEDGPTHEPVEQLASLRSIPGFTVFRPADAKETAAGWYSAVNTKDGPTALILSRQNLPFYEETGKEALKGAYIILDSNASIPDLILIATGSELKLAYDAHRILSEKGIDTRVVSMPSCEIFNRQPAEYKEKILPKAVRARVAVEAGTSFGWERYVGMDGGTVSIDRFGASAPAEKLFLEFGFTVDNVVAMALKIYDSIKL